MFTSATDTTIGGHSSREDDVVLLARFVRCWHIARLPVSEYRRLVAGALNESVTELRKDNDTRMSQYVYTQLSGWHVLTWCSRRFTTAFKEELSAIRKGEEERLVRLVSTFPTSLVWSESTPSRLRLERVIASWKPTKIKTDPTTNFWTVYKKVADECDNDLVSKYVGDLDTSLLFVSAFSSLARLIRLNWTSPVGGFVLGRDFRIHCPNHSCTPTKPHRPDKRPAPPNIATEHLIRWNQPPGTRLEHPDQHRQSPVHPLRQFIPYIIRGLHLRVGEAVDPVLHSGHDLGEYR